MRLGGSTGKTGMGETGMRQGETGVRLGGTTGGGAVAGCTFIAPSPAEKLEFLRLLVENIF